MKYSKSWTQALQEVRSHNQETEVPEGLSKEGAAEFMAAASAAKKAGKKNFKFGDKEYPVTIKTDIPTEGVKEQVGVRKVDFVDGITPDLQEAKPEFEVKYASSKKGPIKVTKFMSLKDAKKFLAQVKGEGMNGIISQNGKPVKEENIEEKFKKGKYTVRDGNTGKVIATYSSGEKASKEMHKLLDSGKYTDLEVKMESVKEEKIECPKCKGEGCEHCDGKGYHMKEEVELEEHCGECGAEGLQEADYELYHKTFSGAMQHAYAHAKKRGFIVDPDEIDNKVATGPKKPSSGKTNKYILGTNKKQKLHVQVANLDNKRYELNMYIEGLVGGQKKLDKDKDGDLDAKDFAMLRKSKKKSESKLYSHVKSMMKKEYANMKKIKKG